MTTPTEAGTPTGSRNPGALLQAVARIGAALANGAGAYVAGCLDLGRAVGSFGREILGDTGEHLRAAVRAKNLRELAELQAAFAQHRIEMSAAHAKEFADLARSRAEQAIAPIAHLLEDKTAG
jgi:hypothetical protein